jgi:hypothetical protein
LLGSLQVNADGHRRVYGMIKTEYAAGFFDGEGSISINVSVLKNGLPQPHVRLGIANYNEPVQLALRKRFGGSLSASTRNGLWSLCLNGLEAYKFLRATYPYLIVKHDAAFHAMELFESKDYISRVYHAIRVFEATRRGYHAERSNRSYLTLVEAYRSVSGKELPVEDIIPSLPSL